MSHTLLRRTFSRWISVLLLMSIFTSLILISTPPHTQASPQYNRFVYLPLVTGPITGLPKIHFRATEYRVNEASGSLTVHVDLDAPPSVPVSVNYAAKNSSATNPQDYTVANGTLNFAIGEKTKSFTIAIVQDSVIEDNEQFLLGLSNAKNATYDIIGPTIVTIEDDDSITALESNFTFAPIKATRAYQWGVNVIPDAESVPLNVGQSQTLGFNVSIVRGELGTTAYQLNGSLVTKNIGNTSAELAEVLMVIKYQLGTTDVYTIGYPLDIDPNQSVLAVAQQQTIPFSLNLTFDTADGSAPTSLSSFNLESTISVVNRTGPVHVPFVQTKAIPRSFPAPVINASSITVQQSAISNPVGVATTSANPADQTISGNLNFRTTYLTTRVLTPNASLDYTVNIPEIGVGVMGSTALQPTGSMNEATIEFLDLEPRVTHTEDAIPLTATLRVRTGFGLSGPIEFVETNANGTVLRSFGVFSDDGLHGDKLAQDGVYGSLATTTWNITGTKYLAARTTFNNAPLLIPAPSLDVVKKLPEAAWETFDNTLDQASARYAKLQETQTLTDARMQIMAWIKTQPGVEGVDLFDDVLNIRYTSGLENGLWVGDPEFPTLGGGVGNPSTSAQPSQMPEREPEPEGKALQLPTASPQVFPQSNRAIILNTLPNYTLGIVSQREVFRTLSNAGYDVEIYYDREAILPLYKNLDQYGVIHTIGHGFYWKRTKIGQYRFTTGHRATKSEQTKYRDDLNNDDIYVVDRDGREVFATGVSFYDEYYSHKTFPNSLWTMIHCNSYETTRLADILLARGVKGFVGFNGLIPAGGNWTWGADGINRLYENLTKQQDLGTAISNIPWDLRYLEYYLGNFYQVVNMQLAAGSSRELKLVSKFGVYNGNFEMGRFTGWDASVNTSKWKEVFLVPTWARPNHGLYAAHLGKMIYPPACGTCNSSPKTTEIGQIIELAPTQSLLIFHYAFSTYLPSSGYFEVQLRSMSTGKAFATYKVAKYPGTGWRIRSDFWHTDISYYTINVRQAMKNAGITGSKVRIVFRNVQTGTSEQTVYLDNIRMQ